MVILPQTLNPFSRLLQVQLVNCPRLLQGMFSLTVLRCILGQWSEDLSLRGYLMLPLYGINMWEKDGKGH
jgi:hypothetical protein